MDKAGLQPACEVRLRVPPLRTRRQHVLGSPTLLHRNLQPDLIIKTAGFRGAAEVAAWLAASLGASRGPLY